METKKHLITMILALIAMCMSTQVMAQTWGIVDEQDWTGGLEGDYPYWSQFDSSLTGSVSSDPDGVAITLDKKASNYYDAQVMLINERIVLEEGKNYKIVVTAKFPCDGTVQINLGSWSGTYQNSVPVTSTGDFQEVELSFPNYLYDCNESCKALVLFNCGDFLGTTIVKKVQVMEQLPEGSEPYAVYTASDHTFTFYYDNNKGEGAYSLNESYDFPAWNGTSICSEIQKVKFDNSFKYARPTSTYHWFSGFENLTTIEDIDNLNTSAVNNMSYMFYNCGALKTLNLGDNFDTRNVRNMYGMFSYCTSLESLIFGSKFNTGNVGSMADMFYLCKSLKSIDLHTFDTSNAATMNSMFSSCSSLEILNLSNFDMSNVADIAFMFSSCTKLHIIIVGNNWDLSLVECSDNMFGSCDNLVGGAGTIYDSRIIDGTYARIDGGTENPGYLSDYPAGYAVFNGNTLTFYNDGMMRDKTGTPYLLHVEGFPDWNGSHPEITKVVFDESFATSRPIKTNNWFEGFSGLLEIEGIENLNTSKVMDMAWMFSVCSKLKSLDLSSFDTRNVTSMSCMFLNCRKLTSLNLSGFNTANVTTMKMMFSGCIELTVLDLTSFDTSNVTDMGYMFSSSPYLETICVGNDWNTASVTESQSLFGGCNKLVGENGTTYSNANTNNVDFAHIDVEGNPGYLSSLKLYNLWIADEQVTIINKNNIGGGCFSYNPKENILTINDSFTSDNDARPTLRNDIPDLTIYVPSDVTIESTARNTMFLKASTTITGPGTLQVVSTKSEGIWVNDGSTLTITDANLEVNGVWGICGAYSDHNTQEKLLVNHSNVSITSRSTDTGAIIDMRGGIELNNCEITIPAVYTFEDGAVKEGGVLAQNVVITATKPSITTDIENGLLSKGSGQRDGWYTIDGRKLNGKPTKKGVYINNGKAVVR